jgi:pyruvate formate lyase activating enzyme
MKVMTKPEHHDRPDEPCGLEVGGITPLTSIDYPGELAAVIFCQGCPWRCGYCQNGHLLPRGPATGIDWSEVMGFLFKRIGLLDAVVFSGGEPTLQKALPEAIRQVKQMGFKVGLHTAGCYPERLKQVLHLLDWVGLDIKGLPDQYPAITQASGSGQQAWASLDAIQASGVDYEVRTTRMPGTSEDSILKLSGVLSERGVQNYALQTCRTHDTLDPELRNTLATPASQRLIEGLQQLIPGVVLR